MLSKFKAFLSDSPLQGPIQRLFPQSPSVTLFVLEGPNAGTVQKLAPAAYRVGSGLESDIVLADEALAPVHALIDIGRHRVRIEPLAGAVVVPGRTGMTEPGGVLTLP
ncbi:FHA domain-containing protein, partial [Inquilinus sp. YAF38]|uniref:FHA domain-containing protein n=1 Tax=Inquilinus sp. YAF38 TaxID=3233084 RepID=UPI003F922C53